MKQKQRCTQCGQDYWVTMLKIYVFKVHTCPDDKTELIKSDDGNVFTCQKCQKAFHKTVPVEWNSMGIKIKGSTQSFEDKEKMLIKKPDTEVTNVMLPEDNMCQRCQNWQTRSEQATTNREKKIAQGVPDDIKAIPDTVTDGDIYRYEVYRKTNDDFQETRKKEAYEVQKKQRDAMEADRKAKLAEEEKKKLQELFPTKGEMKPLIEPEMLKMEQEALAKDIRIEEFKKQQEAAKKLKVDLKKQDAKIKRLKKKLEEQQKIKEG